MDVRIENIDEPHATSRDVVVPRSVLLRIGDKQIAVNIRNAKRRIAGRNLGVYEAAVGGRRSELAGRTVRTEHIDFTGTKVGREKKRSLRIEAEHDTLVDGAVGGRR